MFLLACMKLADCSLISQGICGFEALLEVAALEKVKLSVKKVTC
jgi:hypothetical protein